MNLTNPTDCQQRIRNLMAMLDLVPDEGLTKDYPNQDIGRMRHAINWAMKNQNIYMSRAVAICEKLTSRTTWNKLSALEQQLIYDMARQIEAIRNHDLPPTDPERSETLECVAYLLRLLTLPGLEQKLPFLHDHPPTNERIAALLVRAMKHGDLEDGTAAEALEALRDDAKLATHDERRLLQDIGAHLEQELSRELRLGFHTDHCDACRDVAATEAGCS